MIALLRRNWEYKLLSLVLSILLFVIASVQRNPSRTSSMTVQPEVVGVPADLAVKVPPRVEQVTLTGTNEEIAVKILQDNGFSASNDMDAAVQRAVELATKGGVA